MGDGTGEYVGVGGITTGDGARLGTRDGATVVFSRVGELAGGVLGGTDGFDWGRGNPQLTRIIVIPNKATILCRRIFIVTDSNMGLRNKLAAIG